MVIRTLWDGSDARPDEHVIVRLAARDRIFVVEVDAPFHDDPPPRRVAGSTDRLWEHEVVEVFIAGSDARYLEIELGPHGHFWVLALHGARNVVESGIAIQYRARITAGRWVGVAEVPCERLPPDADRMNAYAIHGTGEDRRHLALHAVPGEAPDFHRLACFGPLPANLLPRLPAT